MMMMTMKVKRMTEEVKNIWCETKNLKKHPPSDLCSLGPKTTPFAIFYIFNASEVGDLFMIEDDLCKEGKAYLQKRYCEIYSHIFVVVLKFFENGDCDCGKK